MEENKVNEPPYRCPACGNTKKFYETGTTMVKVELTSDNKNQLEAG